MQAAGKTLGQHVMPGAASAIGSVAALEAAIDRHHQHLVVPRTSARAAVEPGMTSMNGRKLLIQNFSPCESVQSDTGRCRSLTNCRWNAASKDSNQRHIAGALDGPLVVLFEQQFELANPVANYLISR